MWGVSQGRRRSGSKPGGGVERSFGPNRALNAWITKVGASGARFSEEADPRQFGRARTDRLRNLLSSTGMTRSETEQIDAEHVAGGPNTCARTLITNCPAPRKPPRASFEIAEQMLEHGCQGDFRAFRTHRRANVAPNSPKLADVGPGCAHIGKTWGTCPYRSAKAS